MNAREFADRLSTPRVEIPHGARNTLLPCGHLEQPSRAPGAVCAFCEDGATAHALHARLERQERDEARRRARYPWIDA